MGSSSKRKWQVWGGGGGVLLIVAAVLWYSALSLPETAQLAIRVYDEGDSSALAELKRNEARSVPQLTSLLSYEDLFVRKLFWKLSPKLPRNVQEFFFKRIGYPQSWRNREAAARALGLMGPHARDAASALAQSLRDPTGRVRFEAADALARIKPDSVQHVLPFLSETDQQLRSLAIYSLGQMGPEARAAVPRLLDQLEDPNDAPGAADALARIGAPPTPQLVEALSSENESVREGARNALHGYYGSRSLTLTNLLQAAMTSAPPQRVLAIQTLAGANLARNDVIDYCLKLVTEPDPALRQAATNGLRSFSRSRPDRAPEIDRALKAGREPGAER